MNRIPYLVLVAVLALVLAACGGDDDNNSDTDAGDLLSTSSAAMKDVTSFHFRLDHENGGTPMPLNLTLTSAEGDVVMPDRLAADLDGKAGSISANLKVVGIGDQTWITNPFTRRWQTLPGTKVKDIIDPAALVASLLQSIKDPRVVEEDGVEELKLYKIAGSIDAGDLQVALPTAQAGNTLKVELWVDGRDSLPRSVRLEGRLSDEESENLVRQIELTRYNASLQILAPE